MGGFSIVWTSITKARVPVDIRSRFFEPYATSGKKEGTGLGTYSARLIAETHRGFIEYNTSEVEGTHVYRSSSSGSCSQIRLTVTTLFLRLDRAPYTTAVSSDDAASPYEPLENLIRLL